jgi:hypothetical protein
MYYYYLIIKNNLKNILWVLRSALNSHDMIKKDSKFGFYTLNKSRLISLWLDFIYKNKHYELSFVHKIYIKI